MTELSMSALTEKIRAKGKTLILCHKNPDPDTLGSAFSLKEILNYYSSEADVACCDTPSKKFKFITGDNNFEYNPEEKYDRIIAVDIASPTQLGDYEFLAEKVDFTIDHHAMNTRFSDYYEQFTAACCEIIMSIADALGITDNLPKHFFECVYAGISGDTGGFKYSNVTPSTHEYASRIIEKGIDHAEINRLIFDAKTVGEINAQKVTYENMKFFCDGKLAVIAFTNDMKKENGINDEDIADIVNYIRCIDGVLVAVSLKQSSKDEQKFSISSRSNCDIDVSEVCAKIGGGGHKRASGATLSAQNSYEAVNTIVSLFSDPVDKFGA
jgi:phosphoesterase RecJ-like protein